MRAIHPHCRCSTVGRGSSVLGGSNGDSARQTFVLRGAGNHRSMCTTRVWASAPGAASVIGYDASASNCITITSGNAMAFGATHGLATDRQGYLYVSDPANSRVVVFDKTGTYWSTLQVSPGKQPQAVCVSRQGVVGVANNDACVTENVDFFTNKGLLNSVSGPSNSATGQPFVRFCAFDKRGDFFTDYHTEILYIRNSDVNTSSATLQVVRSVCTSGDFWSGMYSHIRPGNVNTLSVVPELPTTSSISPFHSVRRTC